MRMDQWIGLPPHAYEWLDEHGQFSEVVKTTKHPNGEVETTTTHIPYRHSHDTVSGAYGDTAGFLYTYPLRDGRVVRTEVQEIIWSSGPMYFTRLVDAETGEPVIEWTQDELDREV